MLEMGGPDNSLVRVAKRLEATGSDLAERWSGPRTSCGCATRTTSCPGHPTERLSAPELVRVNRRHERHAADLSRPPGRFAVCDQLRLEGSRRGGIVPGAGRGLAA